MADEIDDYIAKLLSQTPENDITKNLDLDNIINDILKNSNDSNNSPINNKDIGIYDNNLKESNLPLNEEDEITRSIQKLLNEADVFNSSIPLIPNNTSESMIKQKEEKDETDEVDHNPLDFIKMMEFSDSKTSDPEGPKDEDVFQLKNYAKKNKILFNVFEFKERRKLFHNMNKHNNKVTCLTAFDDIVFGGFSNGAIKLFSCEKENEFKSYSIQEETGAVMCMDCSVDANYIIAGYHSGHAVLWNITDIKPVKIINELLALQTVNTIASPIIAIKFIRHVPRYYYYIISSDESGKIRKFTIGEGYVRTTIQIDLLIESFNPFFLVRVLAISDDDQKAYPQFANIKNTVIVLGNMEGIKLLYLYPETNDNCTKNNLFTLEQGLNYEIQDASFGIGYTSYFADTTDKQVLGRRKKQHGLEFTKEQILLALSIDKNIYLYAAPVIKQKVELILPVGKYSMKVPIIRLAFFSLSILFFFDKNKTVNVLNTKEIKNIDEKDEIYLGIGNQEEVSEYSERTKDQVLPEIEKTTILVDSKKAVSSKHYYNFIISYPKRIFVFTKKTFHFASLFNWKDCVEKLITQEKWENAFCLGIDIYKGNITSLADIPMQEMIRKANVGSHLKKYMEKYLKIHTDGYNLQIENADNKRVIGKLMKFTIEFCLEIEAFDYLIKSVQPEFFSLMKNFFLQNLDIFILCDKLMDQKLDISTITTIANPKIEKKDFFLFSRIITHLDKDSICNCDYIHKMCNNYNITSAIIYISSNQKNEDYFSPIPKIFLKFTTTTEVPYDKFKSYREYKKIVSLEEMENSKQYTGHKLLWYCDMCIKGKKYPKMNNIPEAEYAKLIPKIYLYLLSWEVIDRMLSFDSFSYFKVLQQFFLDENVLKIIAAIDPQLFQSISSEYNLKYYKGIDINNLQKLTIIDMFVQICFEKDNFYITQDLNEFLVLISSKITLDKKLMLNATKSILCYYQKMKNLSSEKAYDKFNCHIQLSLTNSIYIRDLSDNLNILIDSFKDLSQVESEDLLNASQFSSFFLVKIHLLERNKEYIRCVETYLHCGIKEQQEEVFAFIHKKFEDLEKNEIDRFFDFQSGVLQHFEQLADISLKDVAQLTNDWFKDQKEQVIHQLDNRPLLQLNYLETIIKAKCKENEQNQAYEGEEMSEMLLFHIELLIKMNKHELILKNLKEIPGYPLKECLKLCLNNEVVDASIYIYQSLGASSQALQLSLQELKVIHVNIQKCLGASTSQENQWIIILEDLRKNINQSESICEKSTDTVKGEDNDQLWLTFIKELYLLLSKLEKETSTPDLEIVKLTLSVEIENVLKKMCCYVSIQKILENVTENFKFAEFKEFKTLLTKMLTSFGHMTNVLFSAQNLLSHSIRYQINDIKKLNSQGEHFKWNKCDVCNQLFEKNGDERIYVFKCKHISHANCTIKHEEDTICKICGQNELEEIVDDYTKKKPKKSLVPQRKYTELNGPGHPNLRIKRKEEHQLGRLKAIDKDFLDKASYFR